MFGWDWGPQLPDMGMWKPIYLETYDCVSIEDVFITQKHRQTSVDLQIEVFLENVAKDEFQNNETRSGSKEWLQVALYLDGTIVSE